MVLTWLLSAGCGLKLFFEESLRFASQILNFLLWLSAKKFRCSRQPVSTPHHKFFDAILWALVIFSIPFTFLNTIIYAALPLVRECRGTGRRWARGRGMRGWGNPERVTGSPGEISGRWRRRCGEGSWWWLGNRQ